MEIITEELNKKATEIMRHNLNGHLETAIR